MNHTLTQSATTAQIQDMLEEYTSMIKIVVDIRNQTVCGGGEMHADCEAILLENGSEQDDLGAQSGILTKNGLRLNR